MNGLAIFEKTDTETKGVFIDQDTIESARQNARVRKRIEDAEENARIAYEKHRKTARAEAKRKVILRKTVMSVLVHSAICGTVAIAGLAGMIHPIICVPVCLYCLCTACVRLGALLGAK